MRTETAPAANSERSIASIKIVWPHQLQDASTVPPPRLALAGCHRAPDTRKKRRINCLGMDRGDHSRSHGAICLGIDQDEGACGAILSIRIDSNWPQQVEGGGADVVHV